MSEPERKRRCFLPCEPSDVWLKTCRNCGNPIDDAEMCAMSEHGAQSMIDAVVAGKKREIARRLMVAQERKDTGHPDAPACVCVCHVEVGEFAGYTCLHCGCGGDAAWANLFRGDIGGPL